MIGRPAGFRTFESVATTLAVVPWGRLAEPGASATCRVGIGVEDANEHEPSAFVTRTIRSSWVAYRQLSGPTARKLPSAPPVKPSVRVGVPVETSTRVKTPSFRLA